MHDISLEGDMSTQFKPVDPRNPQAIPNEVLKATEMQKAIPKEESAKPVPSESPCDHACDLKGSCCRCVARAPRPGIVPNLHSWWRQRGVPTPTPGAVRWRFYCGTCASLPFPEER